MTNENEGWTWLHNSTKWHYFRQTRSLCGKYSLFGQHDLQQGNDASPDNCKACQTKLKTTAKEPVRA